MDKSHSNIEIIPRKKRRWSIECSIASIAAAGAVTVSNPFEVVKTRLQMQGELQNRKVYVRLYRGLFHGFFSIAKKEGLRGIQKGLFLAYPYTCIMNGLRLGSYNIVKKQIASIMRVSEDNVIPSGVSGAICGIVGSFFGNPFYVAKTRWQTQAPATLGLYQHNYKGPLDALKSIGKVDGVRGYYVGFNAACARIAAASAAQLVAYDISKRFFIGMGANRDAFTMQFTSSIISSIVVTIVINPFDVVFTRMVNQQRTSTSTGATYTGLGDCWLKIAKTEGIYGFYKGSLPHFARIAPHTILLLVLFDQLKVTADKFNIY